MRPQAPRLERQSGATGREGPWEANRPTRPTGRAEDGNGGAGRPPIFGQSIDGGWEAHARCYADFRGFSERRANTRSPACVNAPSETFPRLAHRRMASATSALVSCCSPSGVFLQTRSNATSIFARVRISKLLCIMALAHSLPDRYAIVRDHSHVAQAARPRGAVDNVQHSIIFSIRNRTFSLPKARSLILFMSSLQLKQ
jgi:hypothetical protein